MSSSKQPGAPPSPPLPQNAQVHGRQDPPPTYEQAMSQRRGPPPPPPRHTQPPPPQVQPATAINLNVVGGPGMVEICPHCRRPGVMIYHRSPNFTAICLSILALLICAYYLIGILICVWLIWFSDCVNITVTCPYCGKVVRQIQGQN